MNRVLSAEDIEALAVGAWILGTGGGGSPYLGLLNMRRLYDEGRRITLVDPDTLADDDRIAIVSNQGAPLVGQERLHDSRTIARAVELMEEHTGLRFTAIMALEIGGGNAIQPLMAAAELGRPVVDADTMGRAYPEAQMTSVAVGELQPFPLATVDCRGIEAIVERVPSWKWMERVSRHHLYRVWLHRIYLQGAAHGRGGEALGHRPHREQGDPHRPRRPKSAACAQRSRTSASVGRRGTGSL